jgi:hypothetical protein
MNMMIQKIAQKTGIPNHHIVNAKAMLRDSNRKESGLAQDNVHPNEKGMGEIAQEFFMKMSYSNDFLVRQEKIAAGQDALFNKAIEITYSKQKN